MSSFDHLRYSFEDVVSATNNFADENLIDKGGIANVYIGKLIHRFRNRIDVAVRRVLPQYLPLIPGDDFLEEIKELFSSQNVISVVGICDENGEKIIIMEYAVNGSMDQHLSNPTLLSWSQRLKICLGATRGFQSISRIFGKTKKLVDIRIRWSKVLLDKDWEAQISCFGLPHHKNKDPAVAVADDHTGYSLGQMFLQVLFLREIIGDRRLVAAMVEHDFIKEKLEEFMDPTLSKQIHPLSFSIFLKTAYDCLTDQNLLSYAYTTEKGFQDALRVQLMHENIEKTMTHLKIPLSDIEVATESFSEKNLINSGSHDKLYKAELGPLDRKSYSTLTEGSILFERRIIVAIHCISYDKIRETRWFFKAFEMLTSRRHDNIVPDLLGISWAGSDMILVFEYPLKGNLHDYLGSANIKNSLTWKQRVQISLDVARGLNSIWSIKGDRIVMRITSSNVFLDDNWNAKMVFYSENWGYNFIYSFGILLFEILFGRLANDAIELAQKAKGFEHLPQSLLDEQTQWEMVDQDSLDVFSKIAYQCLNVEETQATHLTMEFIITELEKSQSFQMSQPEHMKRLAWLKIPLSNIKLATNEFDETYIIGKGGYGKVYKADLDVFDSNHSLELLESKNKYQLPRKPKSVAIKRISIREDVQGKEGFLMELSVLSKCEHPNIVSLLGYCDEDSEMILIYELVANGSLDDYLTGTSNTNNFTWSRRLRVCLDIANGIAYLHSTTKDKEMIIHRDIKSDNILMGDNGEVKIADFGLSKVYPTNQSTGTIITNNIAGTDLYMDPTYQRHRMLKKESDIYSFGVVLFEIISGKLAYDYTYMSKDTKGLAPIVRKHFKQGTLKEIVDPEILNEAHEVITNLKIGPNPNSLNTFLEIAHKCLAKAQHKRPTINDIIKELQKALSYQELCKDILEISFEDIKLGTQNFSNKNSIITGGYWKVYNGEIQNNSGRMSVFVKRLSKSSPKDVFFTALEILYMHKHENVIGVVGYCAENDEKIIVLEHASNGSLDMHLNKASLGWIERLKICIDVATGLHFLHEEMVVHRDIKSSSILLSCDYKAKISDFGYALSKNKEYVVDHFTGTPGYSEYPLGMEKDFSSKESDIYSFGVILFEILSGRLTMEYYDVEHCYLDEIVKKKHFRRNKGDLVFHGIKEQISPGSLDTFHKIAYGCLAPGRQRRPTTGEVVKQLRKALEIQEKWELKLPQDIDEKPIELSESSSIDSREIPLQGGKMWSDGEIRSTEIILVSATEFSYINHSSHRWLSLPADSRFQNVAEMLDTTNFMIEIETRTQHLSGDYGVYLVFKFRDSVKLSSQSMVYVNLEYEKGSETLHAYFATWRDDEWMTIELSRILNHKEDTIYKFLLKSFSPYYCSDDAIYVAGIEFQPIDINVKKEEILSRSENYDEGEKNIWRKEVKGKKHLMLSANEVLLGFPNEKLFTSKPSTHSRFEVEIELLPQQVFCINYMIQSQMLSQDTEYVCYLVFKFSQKCDGLQCPVKVRALLRQENKVDEIVYFISPNPWNVHDITQVPKQREDGQMEVIVWKFNLNDELENDCVPVNLRMMSYEGSMTGLIICGLEFRPM